MPLKSAPSSQWLIIHGRALGKLFVPSDAVAVLLRLSGLQQPHEDPCEADERGSLALRSLTDIADLFVASMPAMKGACRIARSDD
jgi:hypothetical protein